MFWGVLILSTVVIWILQDATRENKLRLLMILAAIYPEKFDGEKGSNLMKVCFTFQYHQSQLKL